MDLMPSQLQCQANGSNARPMAPKLSQWLQYLLSFETSRQVRAGGVYIPQALLLPYASLLGHGVKFLFYSLHHTPYTLHPTLYARHPEPHTLHLTPFTLHPAPRTLHPSPYTLHPTPYTLHPTTYTLHPTPYTLYPTPYTLHPTLHTIHHTLRHALHLTSYTTHHTPYTLQATPHTLHALNSRAMRSPPRVTERRADALESGQRRAARPLRAVHLSRHKWPTLSHRAQPSVKRQWQGT
jgi:hypothetical protein